MGRHIKYSMCWEDPEVVTSALKITSKDRVLSIASGGENIFAILLQTPKEVIAIDANPCQLYLVKLKAAAIKHLEYDEFCEFVGFRSSTMRKQYFERLKDSLSNEEREFWLENPQYIEQGIIHCGKFESYLKIFRSLILRRVLTTNDINEYLTMTNSKSQKKFFTSRWDTWLWRSLFRLFFSETIMKLLGRDKSYFSHNRQHNVAQQYYLRSRNGIISRPAKTNYFMHMILSGTIPLPFKNHPYLDKDNYEELRKHLGKISYHCTTFNAFLSSKEANQVTKFNLSDIFEKESQRQYEESLTHISKNSRPGTRICYWNNLVSRKTHNVKKLEQDKKLSSGLKNKDRVFFYSDFIVEVLH